MSTHRKAMAELDAQLKKAREVVLTVIIHEKIED